MIHTLEDLGWSINYEKSLLVPKTSCEFIGFMVHSVGDDGPWLQITQKKLHKVQRHLSVAIKADEVRACFLAKICGECIAMMKAVLPAKLLLHNIYRTLASQSSWEDTVKIDAACRRDLQWWFTSLKGWNGAPS